MDKLVFHTYGNPVDVLRLEKGPEPTSPGHGQLLIRVKKRPIHNGDLLMVSGGHDAIKRAIPAAGFSPGCEGVGIIQAVGPGIDEGRALHVGDRVSFFAVGSWQEFIVISADNATPVPADLGDEFAAQIFINPVAALALTQLVSEIASNSRGGLLRIGALEDVIEDLSSCKMEGGVVLLSAAGSTVAKLATAILRAKGFAPICLVRSSISAAALQQATGVRVIGYDSKNWQDDVREAAAGRNIFAGLDAVGGKIGEAVLNLLSPAGTLISYGSLTGEPLPVDHVQLCMTAKKICGIGMVHWTQLPYETRAPEIQTLIQMVRDNREFFKIAGEFPLAEITNAVRLFRSPGRGGTVLLSSGD